MVFWSLIIGGFFYTRNRLRASVVKDCNTALVNIEAQYINYVLKGRKFTVEEHHNIEMEKNRLLLQRQKYS